MVNEKIREFTINWGVRLWKSSRWWFYVKLDKRKLTIKYANLFINHFHVDMKFLIRTQTQKLFKNFKKALFYFMDYDIRKGHALVCLGGIYIYIYTYKHASLNNTNILGLFISILIPSSCPISFLMLR